MPETAKRLAVFNKFNTQNRTSYASCDTIPGEAAYEAQYIDSPAQDAEQDKGYDSYYDDTYDCQYDPHTPKVLNYSSILFAKIGKRNESGLVQNGSIFNGSGKSLPNVCMSFFR